MRVFVQDQVEDPELVAWHAKNNRWHIVDIPRIILSITQRFCEKTINHQTHRRKPNRADLFQTRITGMGRLIFSGAI